MVSLRGFSPHIEYKQWTNARNINSLAPGKFEWNFGYLIFQIISVIEGWGISCELAHRWMSLHLTDDKSTLVQVMAWCRKATSHYLSQCWPLSPNGVTRPQWVKKTGNMSIHVCHKFNCRFAVIFLSSYSSTIPPVFAGICNHPVPRAAPHSENGVLALFKISEWPNYLMTNHTFCK